MNKTDRDKLRELEKAAAAELQALCNGKSFRMCIPVQPTDSDMVIGDALNALPALLDYIDELEAEVARFKPEADKDRGRSICVHGSTEPMLCKDCKAGGEG